MQLSVHANVQKTHCHTYGGHSFQLIVETAEENSFGILNFGCGGTKLTSSFSCFISTGNERMSGFPERSSSLRVLKQQIHMGTWMNSMVILQIEGAATLRGSDYRQLCDRSSVVSTGDHSCISGIVSSWLCARLSTVSFGSLSRQSGMFLMLLC